MLRDWLPRSWSAQLWGDRVRHGRRPPEGDPDWERWLELYPEIYQASQRSGSLQAFINNRGYARLGNYDFAGQKMVEIGPGRGYHLSYFNSFPSSYVAVDVAEDFFPELRGRLESHGVGFSGQKVGYFEPRLELEDQSQDLVVSYYSLEHLHPLAPWLDEIFRVLRPGGMLLGAVPAEGGLAWGLGRWLTSRREFRDRYDLDLTKLICWTHPNLCDEIVNELKARGRHRGWCWPFSFLPYDLNLLVGFEVTRPQ